MQSLGTTCRASSWSVIVLALAALSGCGESEKSERQPPADTTAPVVSSTTPPDGAIDVPIDPAVRAAFSEALRCDTVGASSVLVSAGDAIAGRVTCDGAGITWRPADRLAHETTYTVTLTTAIADLAGNPFAGEYRWSFTTAAEPGDTTPPSVIATTPASGVAGVPVTLAQLTAIFSEPVDCATVTSSSFQLSAAGTVAGTIGCSGATVTLAPAAWLDPATEHFASLTTAIRDLAGNALAEPYAWSFTTASAPDTTPPTVVEVHPADESTGIPVDVLIAARFSEPMDESTFEDAFSLLKYGNQAVPGSVSYSAAENEVVFTPDEPLAPGTVYAAQIYPYPADLAGNHLENTAIWYFTTAAASGRILYAQGGDLYSVGEDGTGRIGLAVSSAGEAFGGVSPDGRVVYTHGSGNLYSVPVGGGDRVALVQGTDPIDFLGFSSNGRAVYRQNGNLYAVGVDGTSPATLAATGDVEPIAFSAAGGRVVFLRTPGAHRTVESVLDDGTGAVTLDGSDNVKVLDRIGPDGLVYYYQDHRTAFPNDDVYAVAPDGLAPPVAIAATTTYSEGLQGFTLDGRPIISGCLSVICDEEILFPGGADLHLGRGGVRGVTPGNRIVFDKGPLGEQDVGTCSALGTDVVWATADPALDEKAVGIHPDGHILYRSYAGVSADLASVLADGSGKATLADSAAEERLAGISPDGWVLILAIVGDTHDLRAVRSDGSDARTLASGTWLQFSGFSASGKAVYRANDSFGSSNLWIVGFDGAPPVQLSSGGGTPEFFTSLP